VYRPRHFTEDRLDVAVGLVRRAGFGHLVVDGPDGLASTPLPFVIDDAASSVRAHLARPNQVWSLAPCRALLIVAVDDAYVSPTWYPSKGEHGKVVPTWNYEVVHLHGHLAAHDDAAWIAGQVAELTDLNESRMPRPWSVDDAPADYVERMLQGIVGVELTVDRIEAKRKLSQNRSQADVEGVIAGLAEAAGSPRLGADAVRDAMREVLLEPDR
jgi:transcriptional regulator